MILLVAAMDSEVNEILPHLELISSKPYPIYEGQIQSKNVALIITGVGKTNASSALTYLITLYPHAKLIINLGIVGGYKVLLHETYIVCESTYHDVDLTVFNYEKGQIPNFPTIYLPDTNILNKLTNYPRIRLYTGDIFSLKPISNEPYIVDMEGTSLFQVAFRFNYPIISLKIVSDVIGSKEQLNDYQTNEMSLSNRLRNTLIEVMEVL